MLLFGCGDGEETPALPSMTVAPSGFFDSDGVNIHYETQGEGKPIVLVHGFASSLQGNWVITRWVETLQPLRRVVALDCRGHGQSDKPHDPAAYGGENMAQDVLRLMDHLGIAEADLFGYSMGQPFPPSTGPLQEVHSVVWASATCSRPPAAEASVVAGRCWPTTSSAGPVGRASAFAELNPNNDLRISLRHAAGTPAHRPGRPGWRRHPVLIVSSASDVLVGSPRVSGAIPEPGWS
jgi:hypothetical protein